MSRRNLMTPGQKLGGYEMVEKIGKGGFGEVYRVKKAGEPYAMKVEEIGEENVLMQEAKVLKSLMGKVNFPVFFGDGIADGLIYLVMELVGKNLEDLKAVSKGVFSPSTWSRVGIQLLYATKSLHDHGYLHRDLKPANLAIGLGHKSRAIQLLDFGMVRKFTECDENGQVAFRIARPSAPFRGSRDFASISAHRNLELGRTDDISSLLYTISSLHKPLPWLKTSDEETEHLKSVATLQHLFGDIDQRGVLNSQMKKILDVLDKKLRTSQCYTVPKYEMIHSFFKTVMERVNAKWSDGYDWEKKVFGGTGPAPWEKCEAFLKDGPLHHLRIPGDTPSKH